MRGEEEKTMTAYIEKITEKTGVNLCEMIIESNVEV